MFYNTFNQHLCFVIIHTYPAICVFVLKLFLSSNLFFVLNPFYLEAIWFVMKHFHLAISFFLWKQNPITQQCFRYNILLSSDFFVLKFFYSAICFNNEHIFSYCFSFKIYLTSKFVFIWNPFIQEFVFVIKFFHPGIWFCYKTILFSNLFLL